MSEQDGADFMSCMREVASRPRPQATSAAQSALVPNWLTPDRPTAGAAVERKVEGQASDLVAAAGSGFNRGEQMALLTIPIEVDEHGNRRILI